MKRITLCLAFCLIAGTATIGCNGANNTTSPPEGGAFYHTVAYNSSNPYNWYGEQHNAGLSYGFATTPFSSMTNEKSAEITTNFIIQIDPADDFGPDMYNDLTAFIHYVQALESLSTDQLLDSLQLTTEQRLYMSQTLAAIDLVTTDPDAAITQMNNTEAAILNSSLTDQQRAFPLLLSSIVKHSTDYWLNDPNSGMPHTDLLGIREAIARDSKGCLKGTVAGFVGGGFAGFVGGSFLGPAGTLAGSLGGAILGGIGGGLGGAIAGSLFGG